MWSTVAASSATRSGLVSGSTCTASPVRMRSVRAAMALAMTIGDASTARSGLKWCSASQTVSNPICSASVIWAKDSSKASACETPLRTWKSVNIPKFIGNLRGILPVQNMLSGNEFSSLHGQRQSESLPCTVSGARLSLK